mgnify:CR=1 FL=1
MKLIKPKFWDNKNISIFAFLLLPFTLFFNFIVIIKKFIETENKFHIPIICVGNIYMGGTGKTPLSIEIYKILKTAGYRPAFIKKKNKNYFDESLMLKKIGILFEEKLRKNAIYKAIKNKNNIGIMDDGFQDFTIRKNINILCFNEKQWIGNGLNIPSGPLRENLNSLKKVNFIFLKGKKNLLIEKQIKKINNKISVYYFNYSPKNISKFKKKKIIAFVGIGEPDNFFNILKKNKINLIEKIVYPDHYYYKKKEIDGLIERANKKKATLITTQKDFMRLNPNHKKKVLCFDVKTKIIKKNVFKKKLKELL